MKKNYSVQLFKLIAAIMVVAIHTQPLAEFGKYATSGIRILSRVAVPIFFSLSGYFYMDKLDIEKNQYIQKYICKILKLIFIWNLIYFPYSVNEFLKNSNKNAYEYFREFIFSGAYYHLWFLPALVLGIYLYHLLYKRLSELKIICLSIIMYIIGLLGMSYYGILRGDIKNIMDFYIKVFHGTNNGLFFSFPFIVLGAYTYNIDLNKYSNNELYFKISLSYILIFIESLIIYKLNLFKTSDIYIFLPILIYYIMILLLKDFMRDSSKKILKLFSNEDYSLGIYLVHGIYLILIFEILNRLSLDKFKTLYFILVLLSSFITVFYFKKIKNKYYQILLTKSIKNNN